MFICFCKQHLLLTKINHVIYFSQSQLRLEKTNELCSINDLFLSRNCSPCANRSRRNSSTRSDSPDSTSAPKKSPIESANPARTKKTTKMKNSSSEISSTTSTVPSSSTKLSEHPQVRPLWKTSTCCRKVWSKMPRSTRSFAVRRRSSRYRTMILHSASPTGALAYSFRCLDRWFSKRILHFSR